MNKLIEELIEKGMGNFMDRSRDALAETDEIYLDDCRGEEEMERRYKNLGLTREQKKSSMIMWRVHQRSTTATLTFRICAASKTLSACLFRWG